MLFILAEFGPMFADCSQGNVRHLGQHQGWRIGSLKYPVVFRTRLPEPLTPTLFWESLSRTPETLFWESLAITVRRSLMAIADRKGWRGQGALSSL